MRRRRRKRLTWRGGGRSSTTDHAAGSGAGKERDGLEELHLSYALVGGLAVVLAALSSRILNLPLSEAFMPSCWACS